MQKVCFSRSIFICAFTSSYTPFRFAFSRFYLTYSTTYVNGKYQKAIEKLTENQRKYAAYVYASRIAVYAIHHIIICEIIQSNLEHQAKLDG